jgi:hypothetical protein
MESLVSRYQHLHPAYAARDSSSRQSSETPCRRMVGFGWRTGHVGTRPRRATPIPLNITQDKDILDVYYVHL